MKKYKYRVVEEIGDITNTKEYFVEYEKGWLWKRWKPILRGYKVKKFDNRKKAEEYIIYQTETLTTNYYFNGKKIEE